MHRPSRNATAGFTLLDTLGYIVVLTFVINLSVSLFLGTLRLSRVGTAALEQADQIAALGEGFARAVRKCQNVVPRIGNYETGEDLLVMAAPASEDGTRRYVVFGNLRNDSRLSVLELVQGDGILNAEFLSTYPAEVAGLRFRFDTDGMAGAKLVRMEVEIDNVRALHTVRRDNVFMAAFRGKGE